MDLTGPLDPLKTIYILDLVAPKNRLVQLVPIDRRDSMIKVGLPVPKDPSVPVGVNL